MISDQQPSDEQQPQPLYTIPILMAKAKDLVTDERLLSEVQVLMLEAYQVGFDTGVREAVNPDMLAWG